MIVYHKTKAQFLLDVSDNIIEDIIRNDVFARLKINVGESEYQSWKHSLTQMSQVLNSENIPSDAGIAIEYNIPWTSKRIDLIVSGQNEKGVEYVILIELKQWQHVQLTGKDGIVRTSFKHGISEKLHPSYQIWSYSSLLYGFNKTVYEENIQLVPCAYLHNYKEDDNLTNVFYDEYISKAPIFCRDDKLKLRSFISSYIKYGDKRNVILRIENGEMRPSKVVADSINEMLDNNDEFIMIDAQKMVFEEAMALATQSSVSNKNVLIVHGGPGTGKSVVAINLLAKLIKKGLTCCYVTKNSAPRTVYESKLKKDNKKIIISNVFKSSGAFTQTPTNSFDVLIVDEAHRLNEKSGMFRNFGENQIKELIDSSKFAVFFLDEFQRVTLHDIGSEDEIRKWSSLCNANIKVMELATQFRCGGSDGYIQWLNNTLQITETANKSLDTNEYDFQIFDDPIKLRDIIFEKNKESNKARLVAGYCWDWKSKKEPKIMDILLPGSDFEMQWNLDSYGMLWIIEPNSVNQVGCIHTCQGLDVDYIDVIVGLDLIVRDGQVLVDPTKRSKNDSSIRGYKKLQKESPEKTKQLLREIIKNTYRALMSRARKGCYVYFVDKETEVYFRNNIN